MRGRPSSNPLTVSPIHTSTWCSRRRSGFSRVDVVVEVEPFDVELPPTHEQFPPIHPVRRHLRSPQSPRLDDTGTLLTKTKVKTKMTAVGSNMLVLNNTHFVGNEALAKSSLIVTL